MNHNPERQQITLRARIAKIGAIVSSEHFGPGNLASLRRNDRFQVAGQPAFHRLLADIDQWASEEEAPRWATLVHVIAITARNARSLPAGKALAAANLSEVRFAKLMAARSEAFLDQLAIVARYVAAKQTPIDWADFGELLFAEGRNEKWAERLRFRIAQDYYRELAKGDRQQKSA
ncbi:type I-E CRISPR-associated protein Cse2/CasB [Methylocystis sp. H62]|jgi:CRISPR type I-E-associated protein CasB/Cse2|uniref:type I-E CRISPR-associated protein Cse2/CasB n=1 Tax=Methylocystis sp. H62 TaxID=2785789 RepID=UPI0018C2109C|nr:type I-E CRISPR-associated protein Cse2/CasB [Methylocystis sp. H62]MBG0792837.1 type I-E CRISPR-associated protein Cse2/CasB [Methylocystis sp. H62]